MTQISPQRNRWVTRDGEKELTYIGREINGVYHIEALVLRTGADKIAYTFAIPESAANDQLAFAGRAPSEVIRCEFMLTKANAADSSATKVTKAGQRSTVKLSSDWYTGL